MDNVLKYYRIAWIWETFHARLVVLWQLSHSDTFGTLISLDSVAEGRAVPLGWMFITFVKVDGRYRNEVWVARVLLRNLFEPYRRPEFSLSLISTFQALCKDLTPSSGNELVLRCFGPCVVIFMNAYVVITVAMVMLSKEACYVRLLWPRKISYLKFCYVKSYLFF